MALHLIWSVVVVLIAAGVVATVLRGLNYVTAFPSAVPSENTNEIE